MEDDPQNDPGKEAMKEAPDVDLGVAELWLARWDVFCVVRRWLVCIKLKLKIDEDVSLASGR